MRENANKHESEGGDVSDSPRLTLNKSGRLALMILCSAADVVVTLAFLGVWGSFQLPLLLAGVIIGALSVVVAISAGAKANNSFFGSALCLALGFLGIGVSMWFITVSSLSNPSFHSIRNPILGVLAVLPALYFTQLGLISLYAVFVGRPPAQMGTRRVYGRLFNPVFHSRADSRSEDPRDE